MENLSFATTPLALASLVIIAGVGILKLIVSGKNNALSRLITHYGFAVVLVFGVLGIGSYVLNMIRSSELIVSGTVYDSESGSPLAGVNVDADGQARGVTTANGDYVLAIPASRGKPTFEVSAYLPGYKRASQSVSSSVRMVVRFKLQKAPDANLNALRFGEADIMVGHYLGLPDIYIPFTVANSGVKQMVVGNFSVTLTAPSSETRQLIHANSAPSMAGPIGPPLAQVVVKPQDNFSWVNSFVQYDGQVQQLANRYTQELQAAPGWAQNGPRIGATYFSTENVAAMKKLLLDDWFWEPGTTLISVVATDDQDRRYELKGSITLTQKQIDAMKKTSDFYQAGFGVIYGFHLTPVGPAQPGQKLTLRKQGSA